MKIIRFMMSGVFYVLIYAILFIMHFFWRSSISGVILAVIFALYLSAFGRRRAGTVPLVLSLTLICLLIIPTREYNDVILRPLKSIKKIGPVEFNQLDKFSYSGNLGPGTISLKKNYINNGSFEIPFIGKQSRWGTGQYSNMINSYNPDEPVYFIKFGGVVASADIAAEDSITGRYSLRIRQESAAFPHSVGFLEQDIYLDPGEYALSLKAKVKYAFDNAIWIRLDQRWLGETGFDIPGNNKEGIGLISNWSLYRYNFKIDEDGFFYRPPNAKEILAGSSGPYVKTDYKLVISVSPNILEYGGIESKPYFKTTFSIITQNQCEALIDNIMLEKK